MLIDLLERFRAIQMLAASDKPNFIFLEINHIGFLKSYRLRWP
jgi:hypothetical protein